MRMLTVYGADPTIPTSWPPPEMRERRTRPRWRVCRAGCQRFCRIYVLSGGELVEEGSWDDLLQNGSYFSQLAASVA